VVSQENVSATFASIYGRAAGTLIGVTVALLVNWLSRMAGIPLTFQIAIAVALCATAAIGRPSIRVCLWTCPLVLITAHAGPTPQIVAICRGSEVVLGAIVGGLTHALADKIARCRPRKGVWASRTDCSTRLNLPPVGGSHRF
jgi:uncharacterized membrane protein YccC